jgi:hypothetical protein
VSDQDRAIKLLKLILANTDLSDLPRGDWDALLVMFFSVLKNKKDMVDCVIRKFSFLEEVAAVTKAIDDSVGTDGEGQS